jgi:phosphotriesterase-related protein
LQGNRVVRALDRDLEPGSLGFTLAHEHVYADFAAASGDADLDFTDEPAIAHELIAARNGGVKTLVEMTTYDMGCSPRRVAALCSEAGIAAVKSTGWFRSPFLDQLVRGRDADALTDRLVEDIDHGFASTALRAGVIGEIGLQGNEPTRAERIAATAAAAAAAATGVGVVAHTDDWRNAQAVVTALRTLGVRDDRMMLAHARAADPLEGQRELLEAGATLAFDQAGHPNKEPVAVVADRITQLVEDGWAKRVVLSSDVGRRSRCSRAGGSGYIAGVRSLLEVLASRGLDSSTTRALTHTAVASFLAFEPT